MAPAAARKPRGKKATKENTSRQTSLLHAFAVRSTSKRATPVTLAAPSENGSTAGEDVIDIPSSDPEPLADLPVDSSSPMTVDEDLGQKDSAPLRVEVKFGSANQAGGSRDAPIVVADSSPIASPVSQPKPNNAKLPPPPKPLFSIFAPKKRPDERESSPSKLCGKPTTVPPPFPDEITQHVRGPQLEASVPLTQHTRRDALRTRTNAEEDSAIYSRLNRSSKTPSTNNTDCTSFATLIEPSDSTATDYCVNSIPPHHRQYPAIRRLLNPRSPPASALADGSESSNLLWNDKWRPKRADEVLGNEQSALYLRDWLLATRLRIHGTDETPAFSQVASDKKGKQKAAKAKPKAKGSRGVKRPHIVRDVGRKRRRVDSEEPEDFWIADDNPDEGADSDDPIDLIFASEDDIGQPISRLKRIGDNDAEIDSELLPIDETVEHPPGPPSDGVLPFAYKPAKFGETVGNTILLDGPSGCGKTAAVYACAEELGWEVFEVYPGVGERSGAALQKLIGDVGKNHLVKQAQSKVKSEKDKALARAKHNFFARRVVSDDETDVSEAPPQAAGVQVQVQVQVQEPPQPEPAEVSQSIILVEEVDILYREDANFWPTMIKIIKDCRRPVVMTCNDPHLVPTHDLPLQATLHFVPCPPLLVSSYLRLRSSTASRKTITGLASQLYEGLARHVERQEFRSDNTLHPHWISETPPDLRRTINQLQIGTHALHEDEYRSMDNPSNDQSLQRLKRIAWSLELCSFSDSWLRRPDAEVLRDLLANGSSPCGDDVLGFKHLSAEPCDISSNLPVTFSTYHRDETIREELLSHAKQFDPVPDDNLRDIPSLPSLHTAHCGTLLPIFDRLRIPREDLVRDPNAIFLDYEPSIRYMVRADDACVATNLASGRFEGTTRRTRNSQRSQLELQRWVPLNEDERDILYRTALEVNDGMPAAQHAPSL
ncbi:P-loop containing nucleoside triphosphate hydrolase protein [Dichomitus squalens]|uniref:P-loop containing nucleoside triphosphate hydrolase protein n=1 Tax=Dichomitus squalens TaxID=114155 RepID=A0A4Q9NS89_9APHY|nr:P-loop containing nucleoside triphosphate hydrolase protein [Dichomitus squalens]TBU64536.1 P-loop containing nucleoside triphosphate hydrolase protein [Dichomitus squalens]